MVGCTAHMPAPTSKTFIHIQRVYFSFLSESPTRRAEWARGAGLRTAPENSAPSTTSALWGERERGEGRAEKSQRPAGRHVGSGHFKHGGDGGDGVRSRGAEPESEPKLGPPPPTPRRLPRWARAAGARASVSVWRRRRARRKLAAEASNRAIRSCTAPATGGGDDSQ